MPEVARQNPLGFLLKNEGQQGKISLLWGWIPMGGWWA
jgi:hypothetical protein